MKNIAKQASQTAGRKCPIDQQNPYYKMFAGNKMGKMFCPYLMKQFLIKSFKQGGIVQSGSVCPFKDQSSSSQTRIKQKDACKYSSSLQQSLEKIDLRKGSDKSMQFRNLQKNDLKKGECPMHAKIPQQQIVESQQPLVLNHPQAGQPIDYYKEFANQIQNLQDEGRYRVFINILRQNGHFPQARQFDEVSIPQEKDFQQNVNKNVTVWCSNDYLGMGQHPNVVQAMTKTISDSGVGSGGTRNIGGNSYYHVALENEVADLHHKEKGLIFSSCFVANQSLITTMGKVFPDMVFISDQKNHASLIEGMRNTSNKRMVFKHNCMEDLENKLKSMDKSTKKMIIFESVYSMSGGIGKIEQICDLAEKYNALTFIDEVHAVGLYGPRGAGVAEQINQMHRIDFISGTLGKAYGVFGGYIAGKKESIDCIRSFAGTFIFTTSLPPCIAAAAQASINYLKNSQKERDMISSRAKKIKSELEKANIPVLPNNSHIIPVIIGDAIKCKKVSDLLLSRYNIYIQPINYPTVPKGQELLRISPTPNHNDELLQNLVDAFKVIFKELNVKTLSQLKEEKNALFL